MTRKQSEPTAASLHALVRRALAGDDVPRDQLVGAVWPLALAAARQSRALGRLRTSEDHVREVTLAVVEKVAKDGGRGLRLYGAWCERNAGKTFDDWLRIVVGNAARDYVRRLLGPRPRDGDELPSVKRFLNEIAGSPSFAEQGVRPPMTMQQTAQQLLEFARARLDPEPYRALTSWLDGADFDAIAAELALDGADDARRLVRAALAVLRRQFAPA